MSATSRFRTSFLFLVFAAGGALALSLFARPKPSPQYAGPGSVWAPYDASGSALLMLGNSGPTAFTVVPHVYAQDGAEVELDPITVGAHGQEQIEIGDRVREHGRTFDAGVIRLSFEPRAPGLSAQLMIAPSAHARPYNVPFKGRSDFRSNRLESVWHIPEAGSKMQAQIANASRNHIRVEVSLTAPDGSELRSFVFQLEPYHSRSIDFGALSRFRGEPGAPGGISVKHDGKPGEIIASGFVGRGGNSALNSLIFVDPAKIRSEKWHGPGVPVGRLGSDEGSFDGILLLRNITDSPLISTSTLQCGSSKVMVASDTLQPRQSVLRTFSKEQVECAAPLSLEVNSTTKTGINCDVSKSNVPSARWVDVRDIFVQFGSSNYLEHGNHWHLRFQ